MPLVRQLKHVLTQTASKAVSLFGKGGQVGFLNYAFEGMVSGDKMGAATGIIAFILLTGGAFGIIMKTGAVNNGILALIAKTKDLDFLLIPLIFLLFSLGGSVFASLPVYNANDELVGLDVGQVQSLYQVTRRAVLVYQVPLTDVVAAITAAPAAVLGLKHKGRQLVKDGKAIAKGTFEQ